MHPQHRQVLLRLAFHVRVRAELDLVRRLLDVLLVVLDFERRVPAIELLAGERRDDLQLPLLRRGRAVLERDVQLRRELLRIAQRLRMVLHQSLRERLHARRLTSLKRELAALNLEQVSLRRCLQPRLILPRHARRRRLTLARERRRNQTRRKYPRDQTHRDQPAHHLGSPSATGQPTGPRPAADQSPATTKEPSHSGSSPAEPYLSALTQLPRVV